MPDQLRLSIATALPDWQADETLYGWASRFHFRSGFSLPSRTSNALFGHRFAGLRHDFPSGLEEFVRRTESQLGDVQALIEQRTLLPYFLRFRREEEALGACETLRSPLIGSLKFRLGLLTARLRASLPLKGCQDCIAEDSLEFGGASWRRHHQWPGAWWCLRHDRPLQTCKTKVNGVGRFQYLLPDLGLFRTPAPLLSGGAEAMRTVTRMVAAFGSLPITARFELSRLQRMYAKRLAELGLARNKRLRLDAIDQSFASFARPLANVPELAQAAPWRSSHVTRLLRPPRGPTHPLRHLIVWSWLFSSPQDVLQSYAETKTERPEPTTSHTPPSAPAGTASSRVIALVDSGMSVSAAARRLGLDVKTAQTELARCGRQPPRRPKKLTQDLRRKLVRLLGKGADVENAADHVGLSKSSVFRILRTTPGLHRKWIEARHNRRKTKARSQWLRLIQRHQGEKVASLRARLPAEYAWLYRNDRGWLMRTAQPQYGVHTRLGIDWTARDKVLAGQLTDACRRLRDFRGNKIRLYELCREVDDLSPRILRLHKLPLSRSVLSGNVLRRTPKTTYQAV